MPGFNSTISELARRASASGLRAIIAAFCFLAIAMLVACGGGSSGSGGAANPIPSVKSIGPDTAFEGTNAFTLTVTGSNFVASSLVLWNASARQTTFVSTTELQASISSSDVTTAGTIPVTVSNPAPGGGASNAAVFTVDNFPPVVGSLSPSSILQGGSSFTLTVSGAFFVPTSTVQWNGSSRSTTFVSSTTVQAAITSADIAESGSGMVTVMSPPPQGGTSNPPAILPINPNSGPGYALSIVNQASNDLVWDAAHQSIYLSVPSAANTNADAIATLNPATATITTSQMIGNEPDVLAISDDSNYLYVGLDTANSVQRLTLPGLKTDISYALGSNEDFGPYFALDLQVAPGIPHTSAVTLGLPDMFPTAIGGIVIYDDSTPRPTAAPGFGPTLHLFDSIQWGPDATALYAANNENTGLDFYTLTVNSTGIVFDNDYFQEFAEFGIRIHYDGGKRLVYSDDGLVINPSDGSQVGNFNASGLMIPDSTLNTAFFIGQTPSQNQTPDFTIESFDMTQLTPITSITLPNVNGIPLRLIRWGLNGLAFNTDAGQVYLIAGPFVAEAKSAAWSPSANVRKTWKTSTEVCSSNHVCRMAR